MKSALIALVLLLSACKAPAPPEVSSASAAPEAPAAPMAEVVASATPKPAPPQALLPVAEAWVGKWTGPEGTFLELTEDGGAYTVTIQSLDGPATYDAEAIDDRVEFQRDGKLETIRASTGEQTGMKWLLEKKDCLTIKTGEGFCRD